MNYIKSVIRGILHVAWFVAFPFYLIYMLWNNSYYYLINMEPKDVEEKVLRGIGLILLWMMFFVPMTSFIVFGLLNGTETGKCVALAGGVFSGVICGFLAIYFAIDLSVYSDKIKYKEIHILPEWLR